MSPGFKQTPFRRINPQPGMMIDVDTWREAHDYHRDQISLHHLALHGWGVLQGLDVHLVEGADNTLRVEAGAAIDSAGRFIIVPKAQAYQITAREKQTVYLVLQFRDVLADPSGNQPTRVVEAYRIQERDRLPEEPYLELARIDFDPAAGKVKAPKNPEKPGKNEVDLRARAYVGAEESARPAPTVQLVGQPEGADLAPRVDDLDQQLGALRDQLTVLASQLAAARPSSSAPQVDETAGNGLRHDERLESLAVQVQHLSSRVDSFSVQAGGTPSLEPIAQLQELADRVQKLGQQVEGLNSMAREPRYEAPADQPRALTSEQVSTTISEHVSALAQRLEDVTQQTSAVEQRNESELNASGARVDGIRHEVDALGLQLQALSRQVDAFAAPGAAALPVPAGIGVQRRVRLGLGEHAGSGWDAHRQGLQQLAREISTQPDLVGEVSDAVRLADAYGLELLYLSGHTELLLSDGEIEALGRLLEQGATVLGEGCATSPAGEGGARKFAMSFVELANRLGRQLTRVDREHPLMRARFVFGELPPGARTTARVLEAGGLVYSDADYGCAWQGGSAERALPRATIRDAVEFGINLALFRRTS